MTRIFISHSHSDKESAKKLVEYLLAALKIEDDDIRCTSVPGYMLPPGTNIEEHLRRDINGDIALIGLLTKHGLRSQWVSFELGAAWGMGKKVIPILGIGLNETDLPGPLKNYQPIPIEDENAPFSLNAMIGVLAEYLIVTRKDGGSIEPRRNEFVQNLRDAEHNCSEPDTLQQKKIEELSQEKQQLQNLLPVKPEKNVDYIELENMLEQRNWEEANKQTSIAIHQVANKAEGTWLNIDDITNCPIGCLRIINLLWMHYSEGKFGLSVQKEIYEKLGGEKDYNKELWEKFCKSVGWRRGNDWLTSTDLTFNLESAPYGHLPFLFSQNARFDPDQPLFLPFSRVNTYRR